MVDEEDTRPWHPLTRSLKLERAHKHLGELHEALELIRERNPDTITGYADLQAIQEAGEEGLITDVWQLRLNPAPILAGVLGDCLHCLKSSLDHAVFYLTLVHSADNPKLDRLLDRSEFPIYINPGRYRSEGRPRIQGVGEAALTLIDGLQPHLGLRDPDRLGLYVLHQLSRIDRHRYVQMAQTAMGRTTARLIPKPGFHFQAEAPLALSKMQMEMTMPLHIILTEQPLGGITVKLPEAFDEIYAVTARIVQKLSECEGRHDDAS